MNDIRSVSCGNGKPCNNRTTPIKVLTQGNVKLSHDYGYLVVGNDHAVCFFVDPEDRAYIFASSVSDTGCPVVYLTVDDADVSMTEVEFSEFSDWRFHAGSGGKVLAIALTRN